MRGVRTRYHAARCARPGPGLYGVWMGSDPAVRGLDGVWMGSGWGLIQLCEVCRHGRLRSSPPISSRSCVAQVLGLIANLEALSSTVGPIGWGYVYHATVGWHPSFTFLTMGGCACVALLLSFGLRGPDSQPAPAVPDPLS